MIGLEGLLLANIPDSRLPDDGVRTIISKVLTRSTNVQMPKFLRLPHNRRRPLRLFSANHRLRLK